MPGSDRSHLDSLSGSGGGGRAPSFGAGGNAPPSDYFNSDSFRAMNTSSPDNPRREEHKQPVRPPTQDQQQPRRETKVVDL